MSDIGEYLLTMADMQGVACSTVSDGHVLVFNREYLRKLIEAHPGEERLVIFVKREDMHS